MRSCPGSRSLFKFHGLRYIERMKISTRHKWIALVVILAGAAVAGLFVWWNAKAESPGWGSNFWLRSEVISPEEKVVAPVATKAPEKIPAVDIPLNYGDAINKFGDFRFQFVACSGTPGQMVAKQGSVIMLDNRDDKERVIVMGEAAYRIKALDYALAIASKVGNLQITCDGGGAATISVQP